VFPAGSSAGALPCPNVDPFFQEGEHLKAKQLASTSSGKCLYPTFFTKKNPVAFWGHPRQECLPQRICQAEKELTDNIVHLQVVCASSIFPVV